MAHTHEGHARDAPTPERSDDVLSISPKIEANDVSPRGARVDVAKVVCVGQGEDAVCVNIVRLAHEDAPR